MREVVIGVDLGASKILYGVITLEGNILYKNTIPTNSEEGVESVLEKMTASIQTLISRYETNSIITGVVIATPGPLSYPDSMVLNSPNLKWEKVALRDEMEKRLNRGVVVEKDTNVAALGEYYFGQNKKYNNLIYITVSTGVGGGIIINDRLYRGAIGGAGEIGHMVVEPAGPICGCGRKGCLEVLTSGTGIASKAISLNLINDQMGAKEVGQMARQGNKLAQTIINDAVDYLAIGLANLVNIFNPQAIILGGGVMQGLQDLWLDRLHTQVNSQSFLLNVRDLEIQVTRLGADIGLYGCVAIMLEQINKC